MRLVHLLALACTIVAPPAYATNNGIGGGVALATSSTAFAAPQMSDTELGNVYATGDGLGFRFFRDAAAVNARVVEQQNSLLLVTTFDNWFTDVGTPLIFANIAVSR